MSFVAIEVDEMEFSILPDALQRKILGLVLNGEPLPPKADAPAEETLRHFPSRLTNGLSVTDGFLTPDRVQVEHDATI